MIHTQTQAGLPPPEWIYDRFMAAIEPELTSARLPYVDMQYEGETQVQHEERMRRYAGAFRTFGDMLRQFGGYLYDQAKSLESGRRTERREREEGERVWQLKMADDLLGVDAPSSSLS